MSRSNNAVGTNTQRCFFYKITPSKVTLTHLTHTNTHSSSSFLFIDVKQMHCNNGMVYSCSWAVQDAHTLIDFRGRCPRREANCWNDLHLCVRRSVVSHSDLHADYTDVVFTCEEVKNCVWVCVHTHSCTCEDQNATVTSKVGRQCWEVRFVLTGSQKGPILVGFKLWSRLDIKLFCQGLRGCLIAKTIMMDRDNCLRVYHANIFFKYWDEIRLFT